MTNTELLRILSKQWANVNDIQKIANCGRDKATFVRNSITTAIIENGKKLPMCRQKLVPMENVIDYFDLNLEHIIFMSKNEKN